MIKFKLDTKKLLCLPLKTQKGRKAPLDLLLHAILWGAFRHLFTAVQP
jgi:hypothetical protein